MPNDVATEVKPEAPETTGLPAMPAGAGSDLLQIRRDLAPSLRIMLDERLYEQVKRLAGIMSKDAIFTPRHLVGKPEACFTVITQAVNWNIDPHFVARATYQTPGGSIGFEGKLVQAILEQTNRFVGGPKFEYVGDWSKVIGKFTKATSPKGNEYVKPTWTEKDAQGIGIIVRWQVKGEAEPRVWPGENEAFFLTQCYPLNSPLWATDPKTQITYLALRRFGHLAVPGILGGMPFDYDELLGASEQLKDVTPPRPAREDFKPNSEQPVVHEAQEERKDEPFEIIDMVGELHEFDDQDGALNKFLFCLDEAEKQQGERGLIAIWESNSGFLRQLGERSFDDVERQVTTIFNQRREAAANREKAEQEKKTKASPQPEPAEAKTPAPNTDDPKKQPETKADLFATRDPAFWDRKTGKRDIDPNLNVDAFLQELSQRLKECGSWADTEDLERHNASRIRNLGTEDRVEVSKLISERREQLRDAG